MYEAICEKDGSYKTPSKDELRKLMWQRVKHRDEERAAEEDIPTTRVPHCDIISGKVDGRALKKITKIPEPGKPKNKKGDPVLPLPYLPECVDYSRCCQALILNGHLFTPCLTTPPRGEEFCKQCTRTKFKYGLLRDRESCKAGQFKQPGGKKEEIKYGEFLEKRNIKREEVMERINAYLDPEVSCLLDSRDHFEIENASREARSSCQTKKAHRAETLTMK